MTEKLGNATPVNKMSTRLECLSDDTFFFSASSPNANSGTVTQKVNSIKCFNLQIDGTGDWFFLSDQTEIVIGDGGNRKKIVVLTNSELTLTTTTQENGVERVLTETFGVLN